MDSSENKPREYVVSEADKKEAFLFIRESLETLITGSFDVDFTRLQMAYDRIGRPWCNVAHDAAVLRKTRKREAEFTQISEDEAREAMADMKAIDSQIEDLRENIREMQHRRIESQRKYENWSRIEYAIRSAKNSYPHLFGDVEQMAKGGGIATETVQLPQVAMQIRDALS